MLALGQHLGACRIVHAVEHGFQKHTKGRLSPAIFLTQGIHAVRKIVRPFFDCPKSGNITGN